jgi:hypothetical protein
MNKTIEPSYEQRVADLAADRALEKFANAHPCKFPDDQRKRLHAIAELDPESLRVVLRAGQLMQGALGKIANWVATCIVLALIFLLLVGASMALKNTNLFPFPK